MKSSEVLETYTKGEIICANNKNYFDANFIPISNLIAVATDGAPSMVGKNRGLIAHLKELNPNILTMHCVIHRQHLVAKKLSGSLKESLWKVVQAVNKIKKSALQSRLFKQLCGENDEEFEVLLLHTEVRWLSKGNCLERFVCLFDTVVQFLSTNDLPLAQFLVSRKSDIMYLSDLYGKFNCLNKTLQGNNLNLIKVKSALLGFKNKLVFLSNLTKKTVFLEFAKNRTGSDR